MVMQSVRLSLASVLLSLLFSSTPSPAAGVPLPQGQTASLLLSGTTALQCVAAPGREWNIAVQDQPGAEPVRDPVFSSIYRTAVQGLVFSGGEWKLRFQVFYQQDGRPLALKVAELLCRFDCYGKQRLDSEEAFLDPFPESPNNRPAVPVNFYLDNANSGGGKEQDAAMYILQAKTTRHPLELIREVAHEFSHLTIPGLSGFEDRMAPETWSNGYLGEVLYMGWLGEDTAQLIVPAKSVTSWSAARAHVLEMSFLGLSPEARQREITKHYWAVEGLLLYLKQLYGLPLLAGVLATSRDYRHSVADLDVNVAERMARLAPTSIRLPGGLAAPVGARSLQTATDDDPTLLLPGAAVRTWVYLRPGRYCLQVSGSGAGWQIRGWRIGQGQSGSVMGSLSAGSSAVIFAASGSGWYGIQWRNTSPGQIAIREWTWERIGGQH